VRGCFERSWNAHLSTPAEIPEPTRQHGVNSRQTAEKKSFFIVIFAVIERDASSVECLQACLSSLANFIETFRKVFCFLAPRNFLFWRFHLRPRARLPRRRCRGTRAMRPSRILATHTSIESCKIIDYPRTHDRSRAVFAQKSPNSPPT